MNKGQGLNLIGRGGYKDYLPKGVVPKPPSYPPSSKASLIDAAKIDSLVGKKRKVIFPEKEMEVSEKVIPKKKRTRVVFPKEPDTSAYDRKKAKMIADLRKAGIDIKD